MYQERQNKNTTRSHTHEQQTGNHRGGGHQLGKVPISIYQRRKQKVRRLHTALTNLANPLFSVETHLIGTCCCILGIEYRDKVEQIGSETGKERREKPSEDHQSNPVPPREAQGQGVGPQNMKERHVD